jgi:transposase-like protein
MRCPNCMSTSVYKSKSGNAYLYWPLRLLIVRVRCHDCRKLFYRRSVLSGGRVPPTPTGGSS